MKNEKNKLWRAYCTRFDLMVKDYALKEIAPCTLRFCTSHINFLFVAITILTIFSFSFEARCSSPIKPQKIENTKALQKFFASLQTTPQQWPEASTRIIHYGDSHVAADWLTGKIRRNFQRDFGAEFISYENKGINGARVTKPLGWDWEKVAEDFSAHQPALIVIAYGTNEAGDIDLDLSQYKKNFTELLQHFEQAAPEASLLVIAPPDRAIFRNNKWRTLTTLPSLIETQRQAALSEGAAFWDQFAAMGGAGSINFWANHEPRLAQKDHVHLTLAGYELVADAFYTQLIQEYFNY